MQESIFIGKDYEFLLLMEKNPVRVPASEKHPAYTAEITHAAIVRRPASRTDDPESGEDDRTALHDLILMEYTWPVQLSVELSVGAGAEGSGNREAVEFLRQRAGTGAEGSGSRKTIEFEVSADGRGDSGWGEVARPEPEEISGKILPPNIGADGVLRFSVHVVSHHRTGMALGEFTEDEFYEVSDPFGEHIVCRVTDIVRKTRFALAERHLEHLPNQTYPAADGRQGPYGHPTGRKFRGIPVRKHKK